MKVTKTHILLGISALALVVGSSAGTAMLVLNSSQSINNANQESDILKTEEPSVSPTPTATPTPTSSPTEKKTPKPTSTPKKTPTKPADNRPAFNCSGEAASGRYGFLMGYLNNPGDEWRFPSDLTNVFDTQAEYFSGLAQDYKMSSEEKYQVEKSAGLFYEIKSLTETVNSQRFDLFISQAKPKVESALSWYSSNCG
jgi:hypothetical protein